MHLPAPLPAESATQQPTSQPVDVDDHVILCILHLGHGMGLQSQLLSDERLDEHLNLFLSGSEQQPSKDWMFGGFTLGRAPVNMLHLKPFNFNYTFGTGAGNQTPGESVVQPRRGEAPQEGP